MTQSLALSSDCFTNGRNQHLVYFPATPRISAALVKVMAEKFSTLMRLKDIDDYITPSQVSLMICLIFVLELHQTCED